VYSVSFIVCVVLCAVFCLSVVCYCMLCLTVEPLPPGKQPFAVEINNNSSSSSSSSSSSNYEVLMLNLM
jgi:hypothetical protein